VGRRPASAGDDEPLSTISLDPHDISWEDDYYGDRNRFGRQRALRSRGSVR
jgi:hypothetical protein